jgi:hypothetical protein
MFDRIPHHSIIVSTNGLSLRLKDKGEAGLPAASAKGNQALNRAGARDQGVDFCQEFPAIHGFGQIVIAACLKRALSMFGRRIRSYRNNRNPLPALLPTQIPYQ